MKQYTTIERLESRRHFAVSGSVSALFGKWTAWFHGDAMPDTITVSGVVAPAGSAYPFNFSCVETGQTFNAENLWVYGYAGNDTIKVTNCVVGRVSGNAGDDEIELNNCNEMSITPLTLSDIDPGPAPFDGKDKITLNNSWKINASGGDDVDRFITSGNCSRSELVGGPGNDDFAVGGVFSNSLIYGDLGNDTNPATIHLTSTMAHAAA